MNERLIARIALLKKAERESLQSSERFNTASFEYFYCRIQAHQYRAAREEIEIMMATNYYKHSLSRTHPSDAATLAAQYSKKKTQ